MIGSTTSKYVNGLGFNIDIVPEEHTVSGLIEAMKSWVQSSGVIENNQKRLKLSDTLNE